MRMRMRVRVRVRVKVRVRVRHALSKARLKRVSSKLAWDPVC